MTSAPRCIYIAGPYGASDYLSIDRNIARAREAAAWCAEHGLFYFAPHLNSAHFENVTPTVPETFWKALDMHLLQFCSDVLLLDGWEYSNGAQAEYAVALHNGMPCWRWDERDLILGGDA